jgi:enoyl-CoA hydratase/carnithine racemase
MSTQGEHDVMASIIDVVRRPPANAMNLELTEKIATVFQHLGQDKSVRSLVLTGQGTSFCAGIDLKSVPHFDEAQQRRMVDALKRLLRRLQLSCSGGGRD